MNAKRIPPGRVVYANMTRRVENAKPCAEDQIAGTSVDTMELNLF